MTNLIALNFEICKAPDLAGKHWTFHQRPHKPLPALVDGKSAATCAYCGKFLYWGNPTE